MEEKWQQLWAEFAIAVEFEGSELEMVDRAATLLITKARRTVTVTKMKSILREDSYVSSSLLSPSSVSFAGSRPPSGRRLQRPLSARATVVVPSVHVTEAQGKPRPKSATVAARSSSAVSMSPPLKEQNTTEARRVDSWAATSPSDRALSMSEQERVRMEYTSESAQPHETEIDTHVSTKERPTEKPVEEEPKRDKLPKKGEKKQKKAKSRAAAKNGLFEHRSLAKAAKLRSAGVDYAVTGMVDIKEAKKAEELR